MRRAGCNCISSSLLSGPLQFCAFDFLQGCCPGLCCKQEGLSTRLSPISVTTCAMFSQQQDTYS